MYDTIIIGAGMSGLAAGIRLAYYEQRVCILERHNTIGGLNSFYRLRGRDYDVGLHAVTNFTPAGAKRGPLARLLRQLRFQWDDFALVPQIGSAIAFPGVELKFGNDIELLAAEIARNFPKEKDNFRRLVQRLVDYDDLNPAHFEMSARQVLDETIGDPLLREMILCPLMWYGNAAEHDMPFGQFCIMFRSIFLEGFARPLAGVRLILRNLIRRFRSLGGELRLRSGVARIKIEGRRAVGVVLDNGQELQAQADPVFGRTGGNAADVRGPDAGGRTAVRPDVVCRRHFGARPPAPAVRPRPHHRLLTTTRRNSTGSGPTACATCGPASCVRRTTMPTAPTKACRTASCGFRRWPTLTVGRSCPKTSTRLEKLRWYDRLIEAAVRFVPDYRAYVIDTDMFTPTTIRRFTWHDNGAVYGAPEKRLEGTTHLDNLFLCGSDQGFVGIVGAIVSGITIANKHCLKE